MMTHAESLRFWRQMEARLTNADAQTIQRIYNRLAAADEETVKRVMAFINRWRSTSWDRIPQGAVDTMFQRIEAKLGDVNPLVESGIRNAAQTRIGLLGDFAANNGLRIGSFNVNPTWLRMRQSYTLRLVDRDTRFAADNIRAILQDGWISGNQTPSEILMACRSEIGMTRTLSETYREALKQTRGMSNIARNRFVKEAMRNQRSLAYKIERIVRTENQRVANEVYDDWQDDLNTKLEGGVAAEEFVPEPDACPDCAALAGVYAVGEGPVPVDDTHPNCNCDRMPVIEGSEETDAERRTFERKAVNKTDLVGKRPSAIKRAA